MTSRPRVLIIAEAANPEWSSVPLVGWNLSHALSKVADAHVVTQVRNRAAIERFGWVEGKDFTAVDSEAVARPVWKFSDAFRRVTGSGWTIGTALSAIPYYYFEHLVWRRFGGAIARGEFQIVHRVTPLSPTTPSLLARKCTRAGVPFVLGPLNGGVAWPPEFTQVRRAEGEWLSTIRNAYKMLPGARSMRTDAAAILVGSRATWDQLARFHERCIYVPENGIDPVRFPERPAPRPGSVLRVAFVGRLVPYKGADMLIEAAAPLVHSGAVTVDVLGDGPQMPMLQRMVSDGGLAPGVRLHGWVDQAKLAEKVGDAQVFAFPSVREFGGGAVIEAMAMGLVPLVVDYAGPSELVTDGTGFRIPIGPRESIVTALRDVLMRLAADPRDLDGMRRRAVGRANKLFSWETKASQVLDAYQWVLGAGPKPDFGMPFPDTA